MDSSLVYSTAHGRTCPSCEQPVAQCTCKRQKPSSGGNGAARVSRETKGRKGKCVTLVSGLTLPPDKLSDLASHLKRTCGSGGTVKNGVIEIQGDHRDVLVRELIAAGFNAKKAGG
jgi:translation initiation factor 1